MKLGLTDSRRCRSGSQDNIYPRAAPAFILEERFITTDPAPGTCPFQKLSYLPRQQVAPATKTWQVLFLGGLLGGYLTGNSKQPFSLLKATAAQLHPSQQQPSADKQPRHKAVVSCRAVAHHFPSQTTAVE